jgi:hypothetical protein
VSIDVAVDHLALEVELSAQDPDQQEPSDSLGSPVPERSGSTVDEAVAKAEEGSQVEGVHTPSGQEESGESRVEQMADVEGVTEGRVDGSPGDSATAPEPGPSPADVGAGGAQRIVGARISDRVAGGEPVPDGPPFETDSEGDTNDSSGAGS